jgi:hypothetical protein
MVRNIVKSWLRSASGIQLATASVLLLLALVAPAAAQSRKKKSKTPPVPRITAIVSEANAPESTKPVELSPESSARTESAYRTSLKDLVKLRETELTTAEAQRAKLDELLRDGLISKKAVEDADGAVVEARARLEDARVRLGPVDGLPAETSDPEVVAESTDSESTAAHVEPKTTLKKTSIIYPRRKAPAKRKTH